MNNTLKPDYIGHRKRIKEKYKTGGLNGWLDYEILEFALSYAIPRRDTKAIAKELVSKFKTINGVLDADKEELKKVQDISEHTVLFIGFLKDVAICYLEKGLYKKDLLSSPDAVYDYLKASLKGAHDEEFKTEYICPKIITYSKFDELLNSRKDAKFSWMFREKIGRTKENNKIIFNLLFLLFCSVLKVGHLNIQ